jgi:hypothetical protein
MNMQIMKLSRGTISIYMVCLGIAVLNYSILTIDLET